MTFKELAPFVIAITALVCIALLIRTDRKKIFTIDGIFAILGIIAGFAITCMNLLYSNNYTITIGPIVAITSSAYLSLKDTINQYAGNLPFRFGQKTISFINIIFWGATLTALVSYFTAPLYSRPIVFFLSIALALTMLGLELFSLKPDKVSVLIAISKILFVSVMLRASANLISPYPIGSDQWFHMKIISEMMSSGSIQALIGHISSEYPFFPIMHLYVIACQLIGNIDVKLAMFIVGAALALSTVFVYLLVKTITSNENIALISMLLLNFADFHLEWSIEIIAMSFGLSLYALLLFLMFRKKEFDKMNYSLIIFTFILITLTHTISSFIAFITLISLYVGSIIYGKLYPNGKKEFYIDIRLCIIVMFILFGYWTFSNCNFFYFVISQLKLSLMNAGFLSRPTMSFIPDPSSHQYGDLINILGFLIFVVFGIIGVLWSTSKANAGQARIALVVTMLVLFFVFFIFPVMGMRSIVPYRWPAFIYMGFILFVSQGLSLSFNVVRKNFRVIAFVPLFFVLIFCMIANSFSNSDTPYFGSTSSLNYYTVSEMISFETLNTTYDGDIFVDYDSYEMPLTKYLNRSETSSYSLTPLGGFDWSNMTDGMVVLRAKTVTHPVRGLYNGSYYDIVLGNDIPSHLNNSAAVLFDSGSLKGYVLP
ncbi:conserved hypothetical protein [Methanocella paludicola SANAE]|uniref:Glycosyltransferase RgtA/B/C/D-like domain-containing protein n=1 Tax=Methanocella paludicola (strain DSM 17711 / JCM 13418 / NBRC 101707 / SANAE) TaxID=304371 RepID=D1YWM8_METPS|nr:hypothetical protein [Methanocella paludicola]BAI60850.1 conserved hypothetical protein [Methanocella paludicola SANAE]